MEAFVSKIERLYKFRKPALTEMTNDSLYVTHAQNHCVTKGVKIFLCKNKIKSKSSFLCVIVNTKICFCIRIYTYMH